MDENSKEETTPENTEMPDLNFCGITYLHL